MLPDVFILCHRCHFSDLYFSFVLTLLTFDQQKNVRQTQTSTGRVSAYIACVSLSLWSCQAAVCKQASPHPSQLMTGLSWNTKAASRARSSREKNSTDCVPKKKKKCINEYKSSICLFYDFFYVFHLFACGWKFKDTCHRTRNAACVAFCRFDALVYSHNFVNPLNLFQMCGSFHMFIVALPAKCDIYGGASVLQSSSPIGNTRNQTLPDSLASPLR